MSQVYKKKNVQPKQFLFFSMVEYFLFFTFFWFLVHIIVHKNT